jgi:hypothetical protein
LRAAALDRLVAGYVADAVFTTLLRLRRIFDVPSAEIEACVARLLHGGTLADTAVVGWPGRWLVHKEAGPGA